MTSESDTTDNCSGSVRITVEVTGRRVEVSPGLLTFEALGDTKTATVKIILEQNGDEDTDASFGAVVSRFIPFGGSSIGDGGLHHGKVDGGLEITANETGTGDVLITSIGAEPFVLLVTAYQLPASLGVSPGSVSLAVGETATLSPTIMDANGHEIPLEHRGVARVVHWETSDSGVATVDGTADTGTTATVTAVGAGAATITGRHGGSSPVTGTATITVN